MPTINLGLAPTSQDLDVRKQMALLRQLEAQAAQEELKNKLNDPVEAAKMEDIKRRFETRTGVGKFTSVGTEQGGRFTPNPADASASVPFTEANFPALSSRQSPRVVKNITRAPAEEPSTAPSDFSSLRTVRGIRPQSNTAFTDPDAAMGARAKAMLTPAGINATGNVEAAKIKAADDKLVKVEHKDPATGRTVIEWLPEGSLRGQSFQKGEGATAETRLASAQAVNQTGEDMITKLSDPDYAKNVGVAMGRYNTLRDFIGNPPPEFAELAGNIESYSLANMGVHGMRSAQGAEQIKALLDQKHTPESLVATIRGLNRFSTHFMENEGRMPSGSADSGVSATKQVRYDMNGNRLK